MSMYLSSQDDILDFFGCTPILYATLRVTGMCNLYCKHCYANASKNFDISNELSFDEYLNILNVLYSKGIRRLSISGGEPFCRKDIYDILQSASDLGFDIYLSTNGTNCISTDRLSKMHIKVLQVSLDGLQFTHDKVRGKEGAFLKAIDFLRDIHALNSTIVGVAFSLMKCNCYDAIELYKFICNNKLADVFSVIPVQKLGRADKNDVLDVTDLKDILSNLADCYIDSDKSVDLNIMAPPAIVPQQLKDTKYGKGYVCEFPYSIAINSNGDCALCDGLLNLEHFRNSNTRNNLDFCETLFNEGYTQNWLSTSPKVLNGVCSCCVFVDMCCGGCRVDSYLNTGEFYSSDPLCQRYFDAGIFPKDYIT